MQKKDSTGGKGRKARPSDNSNEALAYHLSEAIRIVGERDDLPASFYNDLTGAAIDFQNELPSLSLMSASEAHILLTLDTYDAQTKAQTKKGARR